MKRITQSIEVENRTVDGAPAGGTYRVLTKGGKVALAIEWQNGPLVLPDGTEVEPNGLFLETLLRAGRERLRYYQDGDFRGDENATALHHLDMALAALGARAQRREEDGTLGTHIPDQATPKP